MLNINEKEEDLNGKALVEFFVRLRKMSLSLEENWFLRVEKKAL